MTILVHKIHIKTYDSNDRLWSKKCPQKNIDSDDNFCAQDPHKKPMVPMTDLGSKNVHRKTYGSTDSF